MSDLDPRHDRLLREHVHDPYATRLKLPEPTQCPTCGLTYHGGRWQQASGPLPEPVHQMVCPACRRTADGIPAGIVTLEGDYVTEHKSDLVAIAYNEEKAETAEHPLHRIMEVAEEPGRLTVTATDIHLPRRIGEAIARAHHGELSFHYQPEEYMLRVNWRRQ